MGYQDFIIRNEAEATLAVLDMADITSLRERGYPIRRWRVIQEGSLPDYDRFSEADDVLIDRAIGMFEAGDRGTRLTGKGFDEVMNDLSGSLPRWAADSARDDYDLDLSFDAIHKDH